MKDSSEKVSAFSEESSFSLPFRKLLALRGFRTPEALQSFLYPTRALFYDPLLMKGMREALALIRSCGLRKEKILIHGDYDVDGVTAAAIVAKTLEALGMDFETFVPHRTEDGYGVSLKAIREAKTRGIKLLMTVDCGITAFEAIHQAAQQGIQTLVIDHHQVSSQGLPPAAAILNPQQSGCGYPFKELSAAGLAFKLSQALVGDRAFDYLDLAALSTVCDAAPLTDENRLIVREGLELLRQQKHVGLKAMSDVAGVRLQEMNVGHIGFTYGPRINAAGRMSTPEIALQLLLTKNPREANSLARVLEEENKSRQREERQLVREAIAAVERTVHFNREKVIVVGQDGWHPGIIGIVASRLVDKYHRPAVVIAFENGVGKGSCRSIKNFHLHYALQACAQYLERFGGHAQAAGLEIRKENFEAFKKAVNAYAETACDAEMLVRHTPGDLEIELGDIRSTLVQELKLLEPHGAANPKPVFKARNLQLKIPPQMISPQRYKFLLQDAQLTYEGIYHDRTEDLDTSWMKAGTKVEAFFSIKTKIWNGIESLVLELREIRLDAERC